MRPAFDFRDIERLWVSQIDRALERELPRLNETYYGLAFWLFYAELGGNILQPCVSLASEEWLSGLSLERDERAFGQPAWLPSEWPTTIDPADAKLIADTYERLTAFAAFGISADGDLDDAAEKQWDEAYEASILAAVHACVTITERAKGGEGVFGKLRLSDDFSALVCDTSSDRGERWLSLHPPALLHRAFRA
jgi:hypothetical protein